VSAFTRRSRSSIRSRPTSSSSRPWRDDHLRHRSCGGAIAEFLDGEDGNDDRRRPGAEGSSAATGTTRSTATAAATAALGRRRHVRLGSWRRRDTIDGDDGRDTMVFSSAGVADTVDLSANGNRLRFFRNPANITMDTGGVERCLQRDRRRRQRDGQ
jgi:hypothetical protein